MNDSTSVIIVGAGPVGLTAAIKLVRLGVSVVVFEKSEELNSEPRASTFHPPTLDMLDEFGLTEKLIAHGRPSQTWQYKVWETDERAVFDLGVLSDLTEHPYRLQCEQYHLVRLAADLLNKEAPGSLVLGAEITDLRQNEDCVQISVGIEGEKSQHRSQWLIAADGGGSTVRTNLGLSFEGETYATTSLTVATRFDFDAHLKDLLGVNYFWSDNGPFSLFHAKDTWRSGYSPPHGVSDEEALNPEAVQAHLKRIVFRGEPYEIISARAYRVHQRVVNHFRNGRVLLAGDAAHLNSPTGGFGMNSGVHDAINLAEKLFQVLQGASDELLDLYSRQRKAAAVEDIQATADANYKRLREKSPTRRKQIMRDMQEITSNKQRMRDFLLKTSMIASLRRADSIT